MSEVGIARANWCRCASVSNGVNSDFAGNFAGLVSAHAVGHNEKKFARSGRVLHVVPNRTNTLTPADSQEIQMHLARIQLFVWANMRWKFAFNVKLAYFAPVSVGLLAPILNARTRHTKAHLHLPCLLSGKH